jgi:hypothetical protein
MSITCNLASQNSTDENCLENSPFIPQKLRSDRQKAISAQLLGISNNQLKFLSRDRVYTQFFGFSFRYFSSQTAMRDTAKFYENIKICDLFYVSSDK